MDGRNPFRDRSPQHTNKQWFPMVSKWCELDFVHPQYWSCIWRTGAKQDTGAKQHPKMRSSCSDRLGGSTEVPVRTGSPSSEPPFASRSPQKRNLGTGSLGRYANLEVGFELLSYPALSAESLFLWTNQGPPLKDGSPTPNPLPGVYLDRQPPYPNCIRVVYAAVPMRGGGWGWGSMG